MAMQYKFYKIPVQSMSPWEDELNRFLRSVRVVHVHRELIHQGENSFWALAIEYTSEESTDTRKRSRIDYKAVLSPEDFAVFAKLREWRKAVAAEEGVPVYAVFTNEQLANITKARVKSKADLAEIDGVGKSRIDKYAQTVIELVAKKAIEDKEE